MKKVLSVLCIAALIFSSSCKKDTTYATPIVTPPAIDANGNMVFDNTIDGACYSIIARTYNDNTGSSYDDSHTAAAWFGKITGLKDAGTVSVNDFDLTNLGGMNYYTYFGGFDVLFPDNNSNWKVAGNSANGITGFTYTDNAAFSSGGNFTLPAKVNIATNLTISFAPINNVYAVVYSLIGNKGKKSKAVLGGANSVTFTAAEMNEVAYTNDGIGVGIMGVVANPQTINGKKYYFVKEFQIARETLTQ